MDRSFLQTIADGSPEKTQYYAIRVEFQIRGSPHEYDAFADQIVRAQLHDKTKNSEFYDLVKSYQLHRNSRTCRKHKNETCRFKFRKYSTKETAVAEPSPNSIPEKIKALVLHKRNEKLIKVKDYISNFLNLLKVNFFDPSQDDFTEVLN